jgi:clan AA aspartic protease (TIGR02281 family)
MPKIHFIWLFSILCTNNAFCQEIIKMTKIGGVYSVPCKINQLDLNFIFDTGASDVTISLSESLFMFKNGYLLENDIIGTEEYQIANGEIVEGTKIILRSIKIGNLEFKNVEASIVHNLEAPLLFGQSAIERFGNFSVNYNDTTLIIGSNISENKKVVETHLKVAEQNNPKSFEVLIPSGFSPNGDGTNDAFFIQGNDKLYKVKVLRVYDRWGECVFFAENIAPNDPNLGWDGTFKGEKLNSGVYSWFAEVEYKDGFKEIIRGHVTLMR